MVDRGRGDHLRALTALPIRAVRGGVAAVLTSAALSACGSAPQAPRRAPTYVDRVRERVRDASDAGSWLLRYNPAAECGCPPFEIRLGEVWQRVEIGGDEEDPVIVGLAEVAQKKGEPGGRERRVFEVEGQLQDIVSLCGRGGLYASLVPTALLGEVGSPAP